MAEGPSPPEFNTQVAHPARMYDYYLGGKTNFDADREAAEQVLGVLPEGRDMAVANRMFLGRVVRYLAAEGIRQFVDIGTGIPSPGSTNEVARAAAADARVVYVDNDPIVIAHARALLSGHSGGSATVVQADLRAPDDILTRPALREVIDLAKPVAILLVAVLHFIQDSEDPPGIVTRLKQAMAPGSYLVISHGTQDFNPEVARRAVGFYQRATAPFVLRRKDEIAALFEGLQMVEPGLVQLPFWRPQGELPANVDRIWLYAGVGRKDPAGGQARSGRAVAAPGPG